MGGAGNEELKLLTQSPQSLAFVSTDVVPQALASSLEAQGRRSSSSGWISFFGSFFCFVLFFCLLFLGFSKRKHQFPYVLDGFGVIFLGFLLDFPWGKHVILGFCRDNVFFTIVRGLRVIVFGFPKKNLQYFERRVRHLAFFPGSKPFAVHFGLCFFCLV